VIHDQEIRSSPFETRKPIANNKGSIATARILGDLVDGEIAAVTRWGGRDVVRAADVTDGVRGEGTSLAGADQVLPQRRQTS
jgi:hypothetical protein